MLKSWVELKHLDEWDLLFLRGYYDASTLSAPQAAMRLHNSGTAATSAGDGYTSGGTIAR